MYVRILFLCLILIFGIGCTQATPEFETLEDSIPMPLFSGSKTKNITTASSSETWAVSGECDPKIRGIDGMVVGFASTFSGVGSLATSGITINCASGGTFSFTLKSLTDLGITPSENIVYEVQLRAETSAGYSKPSSIKILYSTTAGSSRPVIITAGGNHGFAEGIKSASANFKADIRYLNKINSGASDPENTTLQTSSSFKARVGIRNNYSP